jgi:hypothetical protein
VLEQTERFAKDGLGKPDTNSGLLALIFILDLASNIPKAPTAGKEGAGAQTFGAVVQLPLLVHSHFLSEG